MGYQEVNAGVIDGWCREGWEWGQPISHQVYQDALHGRWEVYLTPTKPVPHAWFGELAGKRVLGLASGGAAADPHLFRPRRAVYRAGLLAQAV